MKNHMITCILCLFCIYFVVPFATIYAAEIEHTELSAPTGSVAGRITASGMPESINSNINGSNNYITLVCEKKGSLIITDGCKNKDITDWFYYLGSVNPNIGKPPKYSSSNNKVLKVKNNRVYLAGPGTAKLTLTAYGCKSTKKFIVKEKRTLTKKTLNYVLPSFEDYASKKFIKKYNISTKTEISLETKIKKISVQNKNIASVLRSGYSDMLIYAKKIGKTKVTVKTDCETFSFFVKVVPFCYGKDLSKPFTGCISQNNICVHGGSLVVYHGRIAQNQKEFCAAVIKQYKPVKEFADKYISDGMTDFQKIAAVYKYFKDKGCRYDLNGEYAHQAHGMLYHHTAVCQGASQATAILAKVAGLTVYECSSGKMNHGWNLVKLKGRWYFVDFTPPEIDSKVTLYGKESEYYKIDDRKIVDILYDPHQYYFKKSKEGYYSQWANWIREKSVKIPKNIPEQNLTLDLEGNTENI